MKSLVYMDFDFNTEITLLELLNTPDENEMIYFTELDLKYPRKGMKNTK